MRRRFAFALVLAMSTAGPVAAADAAKAPAPPDPYLWLEDVTGEKALEWARARNAESAKVLETGDFAALEKRILDILDSDARIPYVEKLGPWYYNFWKDAKNPRGLWRRTTLEEYRKEHPAWETVLDLDALGAAEKENWVWQGARLPEARVQALPRPALARRGRRHVVREFDLEAKAFVKDGFSLPEAKSGHGLARRGHALRRDRLRPRLDDDLRLPADREGLEARDAALGRPRPSTRARPTTWWSAPFATTRRASSATSSTAAITFYTNELFLRRDGKLVKIEKPDSAEAAVHRDLLLLELRDDWTVGGKTYPAGALLAADFEDFLAGERRFDVLFEPTERKSLAGFSPTRNHVLLNELDNVEEPPLRR